MKVLGTVEQLNNELVFLPKLPIDIFFGIQKPNEDHIKENAIYFDDGENISDLKENQIIYCEFNYKLLYDDEKEYDVKMKIIDKDGQKYLEV